MDDRDSDDESEFPIAIPPPDEHEDQDSSDDDDQVNSKAKNGDQDEEEEIGGGRHCGKKRKCAAIVDEGEVIEIDSDDEDDEPAPKKKNNAPVAIDITYTVSSLAPLESKNAPAVRAPLKTDLITMTNAEPFDTLKAQILVRITAVYNPANLDLDGYNVTFTVPRLVKDAIRLDAKTYDYLLKNANKMDDPAVKILVDPKPDRLPTNPDKETEPQDSKQGGKAKKASTQVPREDRILPANAAFNEKISILRARWACPNPGGPCVSDFCFVKSDGEGHFPLSHEHFNVWAASWLKGSNFADENKPPNDKLFDGISTDSLGPRSPLLQRRLELQNQRTALLAPAMPQITINLPDMMRQQFPPAPVPPPVHAPAHESVPMLVPSPLVPGPKLDINSFCQNYNLDPEIAARFLQHKYRTTDSFWYIEVKELKELDFVAGEIAELRAAIAAWASRPEHNTKNTARQATTSRLNNNFGVLFHRQDRIWPPHNLFST